MWPSEEILAYYINENQVLKDKIKDARRVCEFGAGQYGLIGFLLNILPQNKDVEILITDGNS